MLRFVVVCYQEALSSCSPHHHPSSLAQANLHKIGRFKPLLDLVHAAEGSKKGPARVRNKPRSESLGEAVEAAAAATPEKGGEVTTGSRSRGSSVASQGEAQTLLKFETLQVRALELAFTFVEVVQIAGLTLCGNSCSGYAREGRRSSERGSQQGELCCDRGRVRLC